MVSKGKKVEKWKEQLKNKGVYSFNKIALYSFSQKKLIPKHAWNRQFLHVCRYNVMEIIPSFILLFILSSENAKWTEYDKRTNIVYT